MIPQNIRADRETYALHLNGIEERFLHNIAWVNTFRVDRLFLMVLDILFGPKHFYCVLFVNDSYSNSV